MNVYESQQVLCHKNFKQQFCRSWQSLMVVVFGISQQDSLAIAQVALDDSIAQIAESESKCTKELQDIVTKVKKTHAQKRASMPVDLLQRSKSLRESLATLNKKRVALENHKDQIETSKLNQTLLNSMKHTNNAMKSLGVNISDADNIMLDLEDASSELGQLQSTLSTNIHNDIDEIELEQELQLMLSDDAMSLQQAKPRQSKVELDANKSTVSNLQTEEPVAAVESQITETGKISLEPVHSVQ